MLVEYSNLFIYLSDSNVDMTYIILASILTILTLAPLSRSQIWWIRGWDFPRLQLFIGSILLLLFGIFFLDFIQLREIIAWSMNLFCVVYLGWWVIPYTLPFKTEVASAGDPDPAYRISILVANVLITNRSSDKLLKLVHEYRPDILVTLESNQWWQEQLDVLEKDYPYSTKCPLENGYGMHVYSRLKVSESEIRYLIEKDVPSIHTTIAVPAGKEIRIHFLHPSPPSPTENDTSIERDAELLIIAKEVSDLDIPIIVTGDMNDVAWSFTTRLFRKISGLLDPRVGRGMYSTFHADYPFLRWPLDHLFHSRHFKVIELKRLPHFGSDHFPIFVNLELMNGSLPEHNGLESTEKEEAEADEMIEKSKDNET